MPDRLAARLRAAFVSELGEQLKHLEAALLACEANPRDEESLKTIFRIAHTLKGAARAANVPLIESTFHSVETLLASVRAGQVQLGEAHFELILRIVDAMTDARELLATGESLDRSDLMALQPELSRWLLPAAPAAPMPFDSAPTPPTPPTPSPTPPPPQSSPPPPAPPPPPSPAATGPRPETADRPPPERPSAEEDRLPEQIRVDAEKLDSLLAVTGEILLMVRRFHGRYSELQALQHAITRRSLEWTGARRRLRAALQNAELDADLHRALHDSEEHVARVLDQAAAIATDAAHDTRRLVQLGDALGERTRRIRMRPFAEACDALPRVVRDLEKVGGKKVDLRIIGGEVEIGVPVLNTLRDALLHLVRNAVDHGIEDPETRRAAGKPPVGSITIAAGLERGQLRVQVVDDGAGIDVGALREKLRQSGVDLRGDKAAVAAALLSSGISTRGSVTPVSGRGVGLDAVRASLERMGGRVEVDWIDREGTTFTLHCPPNLTSIRVILASLGDQVVGLPLVQVERLLKLRPDQLRRLENRMVVPNDGDAPIPVVSLPALLGVGFPDLPVDTALHAIQLRSGDQRLIVAVQEFRSEEEVVVRPPDRMRSLPPLLSGLALLPTGEVATILNPSAIIAKGLESAPGLDPALQSRNPEAARKPRILVVDDSITTRTLEQSILTAAGYDVVTAVDGLDGLKLLNAEDCDLVVSDIEMPRMTGFELCEEVRRTAGLKHLPIVLVTALESREDRARGLEAGADAYVPKSSFDQEALLDIIQQLLPE